MRELVGTAANLTLVETGDHKLIGTAEIVLLVSETQYVASPGGGFSKTRDIVTLRFATGADALRDMGKTLVKLAEDLDDLVERASLKPADET